MTADTAEQTAVPGGPVDDPEPAPSGPGDQEPLGSPAAPARKDPRLLDLVLAGAALFLLIANGPNLLRGAPVVLTLVVLPLGLAGLVSLVILAGRGDRAAQCGTAFAVWASLATALSDQPRLALIAGWSDDRGLLYFLAYLGIWAIARRRGGEAAPLVQQALLLGLVLNVVIATLQATIPLGEGLISLYDGRAMGFTQNPVFLGAVMAGGVGLVGARTASSTGRWWGWLVLLVAFAYAANLAGGRIALASVLLFGPIASWRHRHDPRRTGAVVAAILIGLLLGGAVLDGSATDRATGAGRGSGFEARSIMWQAGLDAAVERPVVGWGPNRFKAATSDGISLDYVLAEAPDRVYADAHNVAVEILVATGLPGLLLALGFAWFAVRRAGGALGWYALGVAVSCLFEPFAIAVVPTMMLALGLAAVPPDAEPDPSPEVRSRTVIGAAAATVLAVWGLSIGVRLVAADRILATARTSSDPGAVARRAERIVPGDPDIHALVTKSAIEDATLFPSPARSAAAIRAAERGVEIDPMNYASWHDLGVARQRFVKGSQRERMDGARSAYDRAYELNPWSVRVLTTLFINDRALDRDDAAERWKQKLCAMDRCPRL